MNLKDTGFVEIGSPLFTVRRLLRAPELLAIVICLTACGPTTRKLDEATIYQGPEFQLKLVRYFENLPLHYTGEVFRVQCKSAGTANSVGHDTQDAGWVTLGNGGAIGSESAAKLAEQQRHNYIIVDDRTLVWIGNGVNVSFDACGRFRGWYPSLLSDDLIIAIEKPDYCKPKGTADCRHYDFLGERAPRYGDIDVTPDGRISFVVHSQAFRSGSPIRIRSVDFGRTWQSSVMGAVE